MIKVNNTEVQFGKFPDGTQMNFEFPSVYDADGDYKITWLYNNEEEMIQLMYVVKHLRNSRSSAHIMLEMPYIPNARMDRVHGYGEVFTLKYFCDFINWLNFDSVVVLDPHSNVSEALINNIRIATPASNIVKVLSDIEGYYIDGGEKYGGTTVIYFPDDGAMKRYKNLFCFKNHTVIYGKKNRDWNTGRILGLDIYNEQGEKLTKKDIEGKIVLMIDDIISYGGTMAYSADKLNELGAAFVYGYASHTENSVLDKEKSTLLERLENGGVAELFTTNSTYSGEHPSITVIDKY